MYDRGVKRSFKRRALEYPSIYGPYSSGQFCNPPLYLWHSPQLQFELFLLTSDVLSVNAKSQKVVIVG